MLVLWFNPEDERSKFLRNVGNDLQFYMTLQPKWPTATVEIYVYNSVTVNSNFNDNYLFYCDFAIVECATKS
jgi:hypothetical protein